MASPEFQSLPQLRGYQHEITYTRPNLSPRVVAPATEFAVRTYFKGVDISGGAQTILKDGLDFIASAREGLAQNPEIVDRMRLASIEDLIKTRDTDYKLGLPYDENREAIDFALITMGVIPQDAVVNVKDLEGKLQKFPYSKRGVLKVPETLSETVKRLRELRAQTLAISMNNATRSPHVIADQGLIRTVLFWKMGAQLAKDLK